MSVAFAGLIPALRPWAEGLFEVASQYRLNPTVSSVYRSPQEQSVLYQRFLRGASAFPAAAPGRSLHNYGHAFDMITQVPGGQEWLGRVWESWGGRWGGRFDDPIHFDTGATIS